jgi:hypothetical protein
MAPMAATGTRWLVVLALLVVSAAGCDAGALTSSDGGQPPPPMDAGAGSSATPALVAQLCAPPLGERLWVQGPAAMRDTLAGTWVLCSAKGIFEKPHAGLQIESDDRWRMQAWSGDTLVPIAGLEHAGMMNYLDASQAGQVLVQVDFVGDHGWTVISIPVISDVPRKMLFSNDGTAANDYVYARAP